MAAALAASAVEGLGLPPAAAAGVQRAIGLTPETGALVPVHTEDEEGEGGSSSAALVAAGGRGAVAGSDDDSSSSSSDGTDLDEVDDAEIEAYIRPKSAVKIQEVRTG
jgi:hypothetical protein